MTRRTTPALLSVLLVASLATACGDDDESPGAQLPDSIPSSQPTTAPATAPATTAPGGDTHPAGADEVVLRIADEGGFVPIDVVFLNLPSLLITGDSRLVAPGAVPAIYPGPLLPALFERTITEAGIQQLLTLAEDHGLLQERTFESNMNIADAPDTVVTLTVDGVTYEHRAYALGIGGAETDPAPRRTE